MLAHLPAGVSSRKKHSARSGRSPSKHQSWNANPDVARRAREIARTTFDLSDAEVDALLSDAPTSSTPRESKVQYMSRLARPESNTSPSLHLPHSTIRKLH